MRTVLHGVAVALLLFVLQRTPARAGEPGLTVFAAASLSEPFASMASLFQHGSGRVDFNFAGSQQLAVQIEHGAVADVFASADERWMAYVQTRGLLRGEPRIFARNDLVVILPSANPAGVGRLQDLARAGVKVVVAADSVPAGRYARTVLERLADAPEFDADYAERVRRNVVSEEDNVKGVVAKVQLGEADAGFVYRSDVTHALAAKVRTLEIPEPYNVVASYVIAVLKGAHNAPLAQGFVDLVLSAEGQRVLEEHGFIKAAAH